MSLLLATALAASTATLPACSWDRPGVNPFMGDVVAAVDRYTDIPAETRARLKQRMAARQFDEMATIRRDSITGKARYKAEIRDMHFGSSTVCRQVTRSAWSESTVERGLVYCEGTHCLIVPTVCRNLSRITREPGTQLSGTDTTADDSLVPKAPVKLALGPLAALPTGGELVFDAPGAGLPSGALAAPNDTFASSSSGSAGGVGGSGAEGPAGTGVPWPAGALPIGGGAAPVGFAPGVTGAVPEPASPLLALVGAAALGAVLRRRGAQP